MSTSGKQFGPVWFSARRHLARFLHDRVQEAAGSLDPEEQRAQAHLRIGEMLARDIRHRSSGTEGRSLKLSTN